MPLVSRFLGLTCHPRILRLHDWRNKHHRTTVLDHMRNLVHRNSDCIKIRQRYHLKTVSTVHQIMLDLGIRFVHTVEHLEVSSSLPHSETR